MNDEGEHPEPAEDSDTHVKCPECDCLLDVSDFEPFDAIICPACTNEMMVPATFDHYLLTQLLGEGSMGRVYLGIDQTLQRHVAVKLLRKQYGSDPLMWAHLEREAKAAAAINHPNVVHVYRLGQKNDRPYIVMELVANDHLELMIKRDKQMSVEDVVRIGCETMDGLNAANEIGLVHGDIKPANILIGRRGKVKVGDFGLARFAEREAQVEVWGTPYYIAPEKAKQEREDFRSDMYSLGATLFHALSGEPPFNGEESSKVIQSAIHDPTPLVTDTRPELSSELAATIAKMMAKTPEERFQSYSEAQEALENSVKELEPAVPEPVPVAEEVEVTTPNESKGWWARLTRR